MEKSVLEKYKSIAEHIYRKNPDISDRELSVVLLTDMFKAGFNPNQERNPDGTWGSGGQAIDLMDRPCFKKWFGDSKVVKANRDPKPVYHGGVGKITEFSEDFGGDTTYNNEHGAFYFSDLKGADEGEPMELWLDLATIVKGRKNAEKLAKKHNQVGIFDLEKMKYIYTGGTGKYDVTVMGVKGRDSEGKKEWAKYMRAIMKGRKKDRNSKPKK